MLINSSVLVRLMVYQDLGAFVYICSVIYIICMFIESRYENNKIHVGLRSSCYSAKTEQCPIRKSKSILKSIAA